MPDMYQELVNSFKNEGYPQGQAEELAFIEVECQMKEDCLLN